jgi:hypothetical protein
MSKLFTYVCVVLAVVGVTSQVGSQNCRAIGCGWRLRLEGPQRLSQ